MGKFDRKVVIITGGGRGIGAETAKRFAADGAKVAIFELKEEACEGVVRAIENAGGQAIGMGCDVSDEEQVENAVKKVASHFGRIDILVNNAGVTRDNLLFKMTLEDWEMVMNVHLRGSFLCSKAAQKYMVEQNYGKIVNTSSVTALGNRGQANYSTAKAGLQGFTKTLAIELGRFNINVNAVAPGFVETEMTRETSKRLGVDYEEWKKTAAGRNPMGKVGQPEDIANVIAFLASDEAGYVNGQIIYVNGGSR